MAQKNGANRDASQQTELPFACGRALAPALALVRQGYEGEGSLHALLHGRGWVSGLSAGSFVSGIDFQLFRLSITLTAEGERHTEEIIELCHRAIALLRAEPPEKRIQVLCCLCVCVFISCACLLVYVLRGMRVAEGKECTPVEGFF